MNFPLRLPSFVAALLFIFTIPVAANVTLPAVLSDHAVLQKSSATRIWGRADAGEPVKVEIGDAMASTVTAADGNWQVSIDLSKMAAGPFDVHVTGKNQLTIRDVLIGEVWLASGQSNMAFALGGITEATADIASATDTSFRQFMVKESAADTPQDDATGTWIVAGPTTAPRFSAVAYYFGKNLRNTLQAPIGLIVAAYGGTQVESWMSAAALDTMPALKNTADKLRKQNAAFPAAQRDYLSALHAWEQKYNRTTPLPADLTKYTALDADTADWKKVSLPTKFSAQGLPDAGVVWLRKIVALPAADAGKPLEIEFVAVPGIMSMYWNGKLIDDVTPEIPTTHLNHHFVPAGLATDGANVMAVRLVGPGGNLGVAIRPRRLTAPSQAIDGDWLAKAEREFPVSKEALNEYPKQVPALLLPPHHPSALFNAMIYPLLPTTLAGTIWYQGENNTARAAQYRTSFPLMIRDWRTQWHSRLPFYFCQLANYDPNHFDRAKSLVPEESTWAELREAQTLALSEPDTGEAILIDIGDEANIHPHDKKDVGDRLARIALSKTYGKAIPFSGPVYDHMTVETGKIRLTFKDAGKGLVAKSLPTDYQPDSRIPEKKPLVRNSPQSQLEGFAICGDDRKWVWADANIDGDTVLVGSPQVSHPVAVRYLWADSPVGNLYNQVGLPAGPFRTDDFPLTTANVIWQ